MDPFWDHRRRFAQKRFRDKQRAQARAQFGPGGEKPPPTPEPPRPTRASKPRDEVELEVVAKSA